MFRKISTSKLIILFIILFGLVLILQWWDSHKGERSFNSQIVRIDSAAVSTLIIYPKDKSAGEVKLFREGETWKMSAKNKIYQADVNYIKSVLAELKKLKAERIAATDKSKWKDYELNDTSCTHVIIKEGNSEVSDLFIGKFTFQQNNNPYQRGYGSVTSYIRIKNDDRVYATEGMISMAFNRDVNMFRNKSLVSGKKENWNKLTFIYPADSSFTVEKQNNKWTLNGSAVDSTKLTNYLSTLESVSGSDFMDNAPLGGATIYKLKIEGAGLIQPVEISAAVADTLNRFVLSSTANEAKFSCKNKFEQHIFVNKQTFLK